MIRTFQNFGPTRKRFRLTFQVKISGLMREIMVKMVGFGMSKTKQTITENTSISIRTLNLSPTITGPISGNSSIKKIVSNLKTISKKCVDKNKFYSTSSVDYIPVSPLISADSTKILISKVRGQISEPASPIASFISISQNTKEEFYNIQIEFAIFSSSIKFWGEPSVLQPHIFETISKCNLMILLKICRLKLH